MHTQRRMRRSIRGGPVGGVRRDGAGSPSVRHREVNLVSMRSTSKGPRPAGPNAPGPGLHAGSGQVLASHRPAHRARVGGLRSSHGRRMINSWRSPRLRESHPGPSGPLGIDLIAQRSPRVPTGLREAPRHLAPLEMVNQRTRESCRHVPRRLDFAAIPPRPTDHAEDAMRPRNLTAGGTMVSCGASVATTSQRPLR